MPRLFELLSDGTERNIRSKIHGADDGRNAPRCQTRDTKTGLPMGTGKIAVPDFVALDLETTGLDAKTDRIIEIGAVVFRTGKPAEEFSTFINPGVAIPALITRLTGIRQDDIAGAPQFADVAEKLLGFLGALPLCGHQIEFDINFLKEELRRIGRDRLENPQLDSASLSRLVLSGLSSYTLSQVASTLGVELVNAHRALDDARASGKIAALLVARLDEIEPSIRLAMAKFAPASVLKTVLFQSIQGRQQQHAAAAIPQSPPPRKLTASEKIVPVDEKKVAECFSHNGPLSAQMDGYAVRDAQVQMALGVAQTLNSGGYLIAEAGTGVGKSLAYLVPAALWARANGRRVLVSTYTRNVGDQLVKRDLPVVQRLAGDGFAYSVLKGRSNYLCINRWRRLLAGEHGNLSPRERMAVLPLIRWAAQTQTGDIEEQNQFNRKWFAKVWNLVSAEAHECDGRRCPFVEECFLQRARRTALGSHIVVINHALFFSEICAGTSFLGPIGPIVFDEAHHLEECGHRFLRVELDTNRINRYLDSLDSLLKVLQKSEAAGHEEIGEETRLLKTAIKRIRKSSQAFLTQCGRWVETAVENIPVSYQIAYRDSPFDAGSARAEFEADIAEVQECLRGLQKRRRGDETEKDDAAGDIGMCAERTSQLKADLAYVAAGQTDDHVFWIEGDREKGWVKLCGVPLDIGEFLAGIWGVRTGAVIFTSATLSIGGAADYFREKTGLTSHHSDKVVFERFGKPFPPDRLLRCALRSPCEPDSAGYARFVAGAVASLLGAFEKNILVLFTSNAMLAAVYDALKGTAALPADATVLSQHLCGSRQVMLEQFKRARRAALLGADSFWEGVDMPGGDCEIVVMPRLPFPVPTHPLTQALAKRSEERNGDSFMSYTVPEALIRFRQGAGRLIRTVTDRGALLVLDRRIIEKGYGKMFVDALGGGFVFSDTMEEIEERMHAFFTKQV